MSTQFTCKFQSLNLCISQSNHLHYNTLPHFVSTTHTRNKRSIPSYAHFIYLSPVVGITKINPKNSTLFAICNLQSITTREKTTRRPKGGTIIKQAFLYSFREMKKRRRNEVAITHDDHDSELM